MSEKITFTFEIEKIRMEFGCPEEFAENQMERMERLMTAFAQAMGRLASTVSGASGAGGMMKSSSGSESGAPDSESAESMDPSFD